MHQQGNKACTMLIPGDQFKVFNCYSRILGIIQHIVDTGKHDILSSKKFIDSETQAEEDKKKSEVHKPEIRRKLSHAETSGIAISAVMLAYSLKEEDKPLFFLSMSLLIFLLRPLIGALFGKNNRAVQNALHSFSVVLFIGALLFLFL